MTIYALVDPRTDEVRYVGKTVRTPHRRLRRHLAESYLVANTHKDRWLIMLKRLGLEPKIRVLEVCSSLAGLAEAERRHIAAYRAGGTALVNATDGGDGVGGWNHTLESRHKMSIARKGKAKSAEHRRNLGLAGKGRKASPETRAKLRQERRERGRYPAPRYGPDNNKTKLTETQRSDIRALRGIISQRQLARQYGVTHAAIGRVQRQDLRVREFPR